MYEESELSIAPSYQRKYRWSPAVASVFVESVFLGLPIPPIFVATNDDFQWEVVDGLQRVSTLILYMSENQESRDRIGRKGPLVLKELAKLSQLNGHSFADLPQSVRRYFARLPLQVISLTDKSDKAVRYDLFERLNAGAISLTPQEVRSVVYRGTFIDFLEDLATDPNFDSLLKLQELHQHDGTAAEQVLKFFAYKNDQDSFTGAVTNFLNAYVEKATKSFDYVRERTLFRETFKFLAEIVNGPFLRRNTTVTPLVQFEACGIGIARIIRDGGDPSIPAGDWLNDSELVESSTGGTNTRSLLGRRLARAQQLFSNAT